MPMTAFLLTLGLSLTAQTPAARPPTKPAPTPAVEPTIGAAVDGTFQWVPGQFISAAEAMPEDKYDWVPTQGEFKEARTFAQQVKHVAAVNYFVGAAILGEKPPVEVGDPEKGPANLKTKAEIVAYLKSSFDYARKAVQGITAKNGTKSLKSPFGQGTTTPLGLATLLAFHGMDHYGQMVIYLRSNGIIPPASRKK
ncbi:MAG: DinB family protein [Acidobacteriota bacterium]|nr:DinB family protein [Acidobacteriota bacterium]